MFLRTAFFVTLLIPGLTVSAWAADAPVSPPQIHSRDETHRVTLYGSTPPEARPENDLGRVPDSMSLPGLQLALRRPAAQERQVESLIHDQLDRKSPRYHRWITADQYGSKFGVAIPDVNRIVSWLASHGFAVNAVSASRMRIDFSGTAGEVREAFHTEIHRVRVRGKDHITNMTDPQIPAALAPVVAGIAWLNDFRPKPQYTGAQSCEPFDANGNESSTCYWVVPADLWTIYNFPVSTYNGAGQTIVVMEDYDPCCGSDPSQDWCNFRVTFVEQSCSSALFSLVNPYKVGSNEHSCTNPTGGGSGYSSDEAALDPQWASAAAPGANIVVAACAGSGSTLPGYLIALENYVDIYTQQIISMSYGACEVDLGAGGNSVLNATYQQAAAEGFSVFVAAGDAGAADCDYQDPNGFATQGISVSGYASSPYVVAVGGTTFGDWALGNPSSYWSAQNGPYWGSAQSYIPEIAWNSSCGNVLLALYYTQQQQTYGPAGFCNNSKYLNPPYSFLIVLGGSGGPSSCAEGFNPPDGGCVGYPKPNWQSGILSNPADNVRDVPDVSIFAGGPEWGHALVYCNSSHLTVAACHDPKHRLWSSGSGTSYSAPIFAGIQALIDQHDGGQVGNPNAIYYTLAKEEYGQYGNSNCLAVKAKAGNNCVFYDISDLTSSGDSTTVVPCGPNNAGQVIDCFLDGATNGVLSMNDSVYDPAYASQPGWDFAAGIGTPNVANLINAWPVP